MSSFRRHKKSFTEAALHLVDTTHGSSILGDRRDGVAQFLDIELDVSLAPLLFLIRQEVAVGVFE